MESAERNSTESAPTRIGILALNGDYWIVGYESSTFQLRSVLGLGYLQQLLRNPGEEFHALDLMMEGGVGGSSSDGAHSSTRERDNDLIFGRPADAGPMLDAQAKQAYRRRIGELKQHLEICESRGDQEAAEKAEAEIEFLARELLRAVGRGGRDRRAGSDIEKARLNVTRAIRAAVQRIARREASLGALLDASIRTGTFCSYRQDAKNPILWRFATERVQPSVPQSVVAVGAHPQDLHTESSPGERTPFIGRESERDILRRRAQQALAGQGCVVVLSGPPGIGKTRTAREAGEEARRLGFLPITGNCYDRPDAVPFIALVECLELMLSRVSDPEAVRKIFGDQASEISRLLPQLRRLLPDLPPPLPLSPEQSRRMLFNAVTEFLSRRSKQHPLLVVIEDLHWADEGTLSLFVHLARPLSSMRVMVIATHRNDEIDLKPELVAALDEISRRCLVEPIELQGLPRHSVAAMIQALSEQEPSAALVEHIYANSEGNPLFVEELVRHLQRNHPDDPHADLKFSELDLPQSLRLSLSRRLTNVSREAQQMLATASVIGRSFTFALLEAATRANPDHLVDWLEEAESAGLISSKDSYPDARFKFAHELIRRAVLDDLSVARRRRIHRNVAEAIELLYPNNLDEHAEDLAHHLWNAGAPTDPGKTIHYLQVAGGKAVQTAANEDAIGYLKKALQLVNSAPDSPQRAQTELFLQVALSVPLITTKGFAAPEVESVYARARLLCKQLGDAPQLFPVLFGVWLFHTARAEQITARDLADQCLRLAEKTNDTALLLAAHHAMGVSLSTLAEFDSALEHLGQTIKLYDPEQHASLAYQFGHDFGVIARSHAALDLWYLGYSERAWSMADEAVTWARQLSHQHSLAAALAFASWVGVMSHDASRARVYAEEALQLCSEGDFGFWQPVAQIYYGWALAQGENLAAGIAQMQVGLTACRASGSGVMRAGFLSVLAEAFGKAQQRAQALDTMAEAHAMVRQSGERWWEPEIYRMEGDLYLTLPGILRSMALQRQKAEACFLQAIEIAKEQKTKALELRAASSLCRLRTAQGQGDDAYRPLEDVYRWFKEGFNSPDLIDAAQLLAARR